MKKSTLNGLQFKEIRTAKNYTLKGLAVALDRKESTIYAYENGTRCIPLYIEENLRNLKSL